MEVYYVIVNDFVLCAELAGQSKIWLPSSTQRGQGLVEYALVLVLVAVVVIAISNVAWAAQVGNVFSRVLVWY